MTERLLRQIRPELLTLRAYRPPVAPPPVKLDANEAPWPLPETARKRIAKAVADLPWHRYPDATGSGARARLAERIGARPDELVLGVGSDEVIALLLSAFRRTPFGRDAPRVVFPAPTFVMYGISSRMMGVVPVPVPLRPEDWSLEPERLVEAARSAEASLVFVASPNNPTGNAFPLDALRHVADSLPETLVVVDEAYRPYADGDATALYAERGNVGLLGTLSKAGLAGLRFGWARLPTALAAAVDKVRQPYSLSAPAQVVAELAFGDLAPVLDDLVARVRSERTRLENALDSCAAIRRRYPSSANFVLVEVDDAARTFETLRDRGVLVRRFPGQPALADRHLRITVGTGDDTDALLDALR